MNNRIRGVIVPILTPMSRNEEIDHASLRRLTNYLIDSGAHGIWVGGTTGEFSGLSEKQRIESIETVVNEVSGRVPVIGNISAPGTRLAITLALLLQDSGLQGIAATPPYYNPSSQDELLIHYREIREQTGLPLWVYNIPSTVKTVVEPSTIAKLASEKTVVGIKDSSGGGESLAQLTFLCEQAGIELYRFAGTVFRIATTNAIGAHGVIPSISNLIPEISVKAWEAGQIGDIETAHAYISKMTIASKLQNFNRSGGPVSKTISILKTSLKMMGVIDTDYMTKPLKPLAEEEKKSIPGILRELQLLT